VGHRDRRARRRGGLHDAVIRQCHVVRPGRGGVDLRSLRSDPGEPFPGWKARATRGRRCRPW
jgi:hypothetical protein